MRTKNGFSILLITAIIFSFSSCHFNSTFINREEDKNDAEKITNQFYDVVKTNQYTKTHTLFSNSFFEVTDTAKLNNIFKTTLAKLGSIEDISLGKWETKIIKGTDAKSNYVLQYIVKRKNFDSKESITLTREDEQIKILGYKINSEGFLTPEKQ